MEVKREDIAKTLDARGLSCPMPLLKTKKALETLEKGEVLEVLTTDPGSKNDIPSFCKKKGYDLLSIEDDPGGFIRYLIRA